MDNKNLKELKEKVDLKELDKLPETIEDIENHPILKPLLEYHKQTSMLEKEDKIEANFLKEIKDEIDEDLKLGIYDNSSIVKKYINLTKEYQRLVLIYSRYTDLADEKIVELKKIVEKYYITKKEHKRTMEEVGGNNKKTKLNPYAKDEKEEPEEEGELYDEFMKTKKNKVKSKK